MAEERKSTPQAGALRENASELRRFARALMAPCSPQGADALAHAAFARVGGDRGATDAREQALGELVRLNRRRLREAPADSSGAPQPSGQVSGQIASQVAALPLDERETLLLVALAGLSYEAAARALEIPRASVVSRLMRARARLEGGRAGSPGRTGHLRLIK